MEAEVREHKRLFLEQKRQIAEQLARQEALEKDVAALKAMLEKVTRMLLENRGYQGEFPFSGQAVSSSSCHTDFLITACGKNCHLHFWALKYRCKAYLEGSLLSVREADLQCLGF